MPKDKRIPAAKVRLGVVGYYDMAVAKLRQLKCSDQSFETQLVRVVRQALRLSMDSRPDTADLPLLIIDGLVKSNENKDFVGALYEAVVESHITALILVKDVDWANELIKLNGGVQILPVDQVIDNPRRDVTKPFKTTPQWKGMGWRLQDIQAFADMEGIRGVALQEGMTPQQVLDAHEVAKRSQTQTQSGHDGS